MTCTTHLPCCLAAAGPSSGLPYISAAVYAASCKTALSVLTFKLHPLVAAVDVLPVYLATTALASQS